MFLKELEKKSPEEILQWAIHEYGDRVALASSFGMEDMVLIDMISKFDKPMTIFTLDTGRLHEETYEVMELVRTRYGLSVKSYFPNKETVEILEREKGFYSFRENLENRKECCGIRKVEPLNRALGELDAWTTGLRRDQNNTRTHISKVEEDLDHPPLIKVNPICDWSLKQVEEYVRVYNVPINKLHAKNFPSIGCAPCTRAIKPGEGIRAGRWWWENPDHKECGLHPS